MLSDKEKAAREVKEDLIFLNDILFVIRDRRISIFLITILTSIIGALYANLKKPTWGGEFQIVLRDENISPTNNFSDIKGPEILKNIAGFEGNGNIKTEVEILTSQSILRPIYNNDVKKSAKALEKPYVSYKKWLKSLDVNLKKGTNVLDISYKSRDKDTVLPILNKISKTYQDYSGQSRKKGISSTSKYLNEQIEILTIQSKESMDKLQSFSLQNKIGSFDGLPNPSNLEPKLNNINRANLERKTNEFNLNLSQDTSLNRDTNNKGIKENRYKAQFLKLEELETNLQELSAFYKPNSQRIKSLKLRINEVKKSIKRPKDILIKYRELYRNAIRDERLLSKLEDELSSLNLIKSKQTDPWKLISTPSLIDEPVAPNKIGLFVLSILSGLLVSILFFIYKSYKNDFILSSYRLIDLLNFPLLKTFSNKFKFSWESDIKLLIRNKINLNQNESLGILPLCDITSKNFSFFDELIKKYVGDIDLIRSNELIELENCKIVILIISQNQSKYYEIHSLVESLKLSKINMIGWIFLEEI